MGDKLLKYLALSSLYGFIRTSCKVSNGTMEVYDHAEKKTKTIPLLYTDKAMTVFMGSVFGMYMWPKYMWNDLGLLEIYLDNSKDAKLYGYYKPKRSYTDYIFY